MLVRWATTRRCCRTRPQARMRDDACTDDSECGRRESPSTFTLVRAPPCTKAKRQRASAARRFNSH